MSDRAEPEPGTRPREGRARARPSFGARAGELGRLMDARRGAWRRRHANEIRAELEDHVERRVAGLMEAGLTPTEARAEAERRLGDMGRIEEECMEIARRRRSRLRIAGWIDDGVKDVTVALRMYRRRPLLAVGVVMTVMLAIGAATGVFSMVRGVLLAPLAFPDADRLYSVWTRYLPETGYDFEYFSISGPELVDYRETTRAMAGVAAYGGAAMNLTPDVGEPERLRVVQGTPNLLDVLGVPPVLGRGFTPADGAPGASCVTVLGDGLWRDRFGGDVVIVGRDIRLNGSPCTIVGVMPAGFAFPDERTRMYTTAEMDPSDPLWDRESHGYLAVARLGADVSFTEAEIELSTLRARWSAEYPDHYARGHFLVLRPLIDDVVGDARGSLLALLGAVGVVLLIVIVNVAGLLLAGSEARRREFAVRAALGVGRARLVRQLLTESQLLALGGGALGLLAAHWILRGLIAFYPGRLPRAQEIHIDGHVLLFTAAVAMASGLFFGVFPAMRVSSVRVGEALRTFGSGASRRRAGAHVRGAFVTGQTALALVLAMGAALLARSHARMRSVDLGFEPANVVTFSVVVPSGSYPDDAEARRVVLRLAERLATIPGVDAAGAVSDLPLLSGGGADDFLIENRPPPAPGRPAWNARYQMATSGAAAALGVRVVEGRWIEATDVAGSPPVAVVNEATARAYFAGEDPIGQRIRYFGPDSTWITIVGVVGDVRQLGVTADPPPAIYASLDQAPRPAYSGRAMNLLVRFQPVVSTGTSVVRAAAAEVDPTLPLGQLTTLDAVVADATGRSRFTTTLMSAFASVALVLGALGVYGVLAYSVGQRRHEIGVRLALGAKRESVLGMVVGQGLALVFVGVVVGFLATLGLRRTFEGLLYGVQPLDPVSLAAAVAALLVVSLAACSVPAWRASRVDPVTALRGQ